MIDTRPSKDSPSYAPVAGVMSVIRRYRDRGLPDQVTPKVLEAIGVPAGNTGRVYQALRHLRLLDEDGRRTEQFDRLRRAATEDFQGVLAEIVRSAYHEVFTIVDPEQDSPMAITDAFRHYEPAAQRGRMVSLFLGLCREAGIGPEKRPRRSGAQSPKAQERPARRTVEKGRPQEPAAAASAVPVKFEERHDHDPAVPDYRLLSVLLQQLPRDGHWTRERRDRWMQAMAATVDLVVDVTEE